MPGPATARALRRPAPPADRLGRDGCRPPRDAVPAHGAHERERPLAQLRVRLGANDLAGDRAAVRRMRTSSSVHAGQPARWPATAAASAVSPAISRSSPSGSAAAISMRSSASCVFHHHPSRRLAGLGCPTGAVDPPSSATRRRARARRVRVFTVPSGHSSRSAISALRQPLAIGEDDDRPLDLRHVAERRARRLRAARPASAAASGPGSGTAPPRTTASGRAGRAAASDSSSSPRPRRARPAAAAGRPRAAGRRSGCGRSSAATSPSDATRRIEQLGPVPEREERLLHDLLGDLPIAVSRSATAWIAVDVPVVERREGVLRSGRDGTDERGLVGVADRRSAIPYASRGPRFRGPVAGRRAGAAGPRTPVENTTSVSVENTCAVVWTRRTIALEVAPCRGPGS